MAEAQPTTDSLLKFLSVIIINIITQTQYNRYIHYHRKGRGKGMREGMERERGGGGRRFWSLPLYCCHNSNGSVEVVAQGSFAAQGPLA
eukprot:2792251-Pyramimonas_sp.AAC.1